MTDNNLGTGIARLEFASFRNVIDGKLVGSSETRCTVNPSTLENNPQVPLSTIDDVDVSVEAAKRAAASWANVPWLERRQALEKFADALEALSQDFGQMLTKETGQPQALVRYEIDFSVKIIRAFCESTIEEVVTEGPDGSKVITRYTPVGVAVGIAPWNVPIMIAATKLAPALLTGNAFILKPSPFAPYCALKLAELAQRFFPPGVFQALSGDDKLGPWLTEHPGVDKVSFTGSTATGKRVMQSCSKTLKRVTLELGGNDPAIVCADVDPQVVAPKLVLAALMNCGQLCVAIKRVFIHESIYQPVLTAMVEFVKTLQVGDGFDENVSIGPISNPPQLHRVKDFLKDIEDSGLKVAYGDMKPSIERKGFFVSPTIVDNPPEDSRIVVEEPFGPVFPVLKWTEEDDVIKRANNTDFGLGASIWTRDQAQAQRLLNRLKAGNIWINAHAELHPSATVSGHKQSGLGAELGTEALKAHCNAQSVYLPRGFGV